MNEGARQANDQARHNTERDQRTRVIQLLTEIRDELRWHFRDDPREVAEAVDAVREEPR